MKKAEKVKINAMISIAMSLSVIAKKEAHKLGSADYSKPLDVAEAAEEWAMAAAKEYASLLNAEKMFGTQDEA